MRTPTIVAALALLSIVLACNKPAAEAEPDASATSKQQGAFVVSGETREETADGLTLVVPVEWTRAPVRSSMRKAEFVLPGPGGEARLVVYRFEGGAGSAAKNIERWEAQIEPVAGGPTTTAKTAEVDVNGLHVTSVDARGRFAGQRMPGAPEQPPIDDARLLAAAIELGSGAGDPFYLKLVGPAATIDVWADAWTELLAKLAPSGP